MKDILRALQVAGNHGLCQVKLVTDCKLAVDMLHQKDCLANKYRLIVNTCREAAEKLENLEIVHCGRNSNKIADGMAKRSRKEEVSECN